MTRDYTLLLERLTKEATDQGLLIELGWLSLCKMWLPNGGTEAQLELLRNAFFAGAQHLFASILTILDPDEEPTEADMQRMSQISDELEAFRRTLPTL
jgi:hypothetical protein